MQSKVIRDAQERDSKALAAIYNHYIRHTVVTFEEVELTSADMAARVHKVAAEGFWWLVAEVEGVVLGYAYATKWQSRAAYRHSVEISVYLHHEHAGKGYGTALYDVLFQRLRAKGLHTVIGGVALPNPASERLHEKFGMTKVAHFREVGNKFGRWIDVGYWQLQLG